MSRAIKRLIAAAAVFAVALLGAFVWLMAEFNNPGPSTEPVTVVLPQGSGLSAISRRLVEAGVIERDWVFVNGVRVKGAARGLQAGEYELPARASPRQIMDILVSGRTVVRRITIPEGLTTTQVVALVQAADGLAGEIATRPPEGRLLPETYHFHLDDDRGALVQRMQDKMERALAAHWESRQPNLPLKNPDEALILASIVEKETSLEEERPRIAAVFLNRLRKGMRLQSDPTVSYGITGGSGPMDRPLTRKDLRTPTAFNTYRIRGLPPHPIANPGISSIIAVLNPIETDELFFVADGSGGHAFAKTLQEHNRNVRKWRRLQAESK